MLFSLDSLKAYGILTRKEKPKRLLYHSVIFLTYKCHCVVHICYVMRSLPDSFSPLLWLAPWNVNTKQATVSQVDESSSHEGNSSKGSERIMDPGRQKGLASLRTYTAER